MCNKSYVESNCKVIEFYQKTENICLVRLESKQISELVKPGQFVNVQVSDDKIPTPILRRPFAVSDVYGDIFEIIFEVKGRGTAILKNKMIPGSYFNISGPLGNTFFDMNSDRKKILLAGGLGIAPIKLLGKHLISLGKDVSLFWGNRDKSQFFDLQEFESMDLKLFVSTDNGSLGFKGNILDLLKNTQDSEDLKNADIYVVGPTVMMKAVSSYLHDKGVECQVSLEEPMACGIGVCQGCAVEKSDGTGFLLVCKDGPVFYSSKIKI
ncbi:MAG: dihydroorotate dehydrogenase electron transfer subunit [Candidatus Delongbacteria bacterium]|nr:dihydroorotate dehydrogenase electron transfer subunit [Candidatus Delongbacteria bacterium]MBN2835660.1 dihydroorotate dehydrogenase electron transfer subunit [Candidatus Delongbacteria bacterium]